MVSPIARVAKASRTPAKTLGIMVCRTAGEPPIPEKDYFRRLTRLGQKLGITVYVFFPHQIDWPRRRVLGYGYSASMKSWERSFFPLPDVVYDRCFYSNAHSYALSREPIRRLQAWPGTKFLGYGLKGKWTIYGMMQNDPDLAAHLPQTELLRHPGDVARWLDEKGELFVKPHGGSHGKGALHIFEHAQGFAVRGRTWLNEPVWRQFRSRSRLLAWVARFTSGRKTIIQRYLTLSTADGDAFDIRALVQKNGRGLWELTGMAVRRGAPGSVTSNLHGGGHAGEAQPFLLQRYGAEHCERIMETIRRVALHVPVVLEQYHGRLAELGVDIGVDADGYVWVIEANSKPGRSSFAAISNESVRLAAIRNPMLYANYLLKGRPIAARPDPLPINPNKSLITE
ncbi:MAG: hypothetical protein K0Q59_964 [Paenibacillus sp.]|jgi:glutathione synthase/RimK-type ligase-like ATP-grasp enzyme|nr:hypothetical protein [Paenibacillus sp.]